MRIRMKGIARNEVEEQGDPGPEHLLTTQCQYLGKYPEIKSNHWLS